MNRISKYLVTAVLSVIMLCLISGCSYDVSLSTVDSLFALPSVPSVYAGLSEELDELIENGYEYISPSSGQNTRALQMRDLDADGIQEAIAILRKENTNMLEIRVYKRNGSTYEQHCVIENEAASIDTLYYEDFTGDTRKEIVVGWKMNNDRRVVTMYSISREAIELMSCNYHICALEKIEGIDEPLLLILRRNESGNNVAEFYRWQTDIMAISDSCMISSTNAEVSNGSIVNGKLATGESAIFVTGVTDTNKAKTDILVAENGRFNNLCTEENRVLHLNYDYRQLEPQDINGDGITELPYAQTATGADGMLVASIDTIIDWIQYNSEGELMAVEETFHCQTGGWYYVLPEHLWNRVSVTGVEIGSGESQHIFTIDQIQVMSVYTISSDNREDRGTMGNRFIMKRQNKTVYAAELYEGANEYALTEDLLLRSFDLTGAAWTPNS